MKLVNVQRSWNYVWYFFQNAMATIFFVIKTPPHFLASISVFCNKYRRKVKGKWENRGSNCCKNTEIKIRDTAASLNDQQLVLKIGTYKFGECQKFVYEIS